MNPRPSGTIAGDLTRFGFSDPGRAQRLLDDPALAPLLTVPGGLGRGDLAREASAVPDPDEALLGLVRFVEALTHSPVAEEALTALRADAAYRRTLLLLLGSSLALTDHLVAHPEHWPAVRDAAPMTTAERVAALQGEVATDGPRSSEDALRVGYRRQLLGIAALDVCVPEPTESFVPTAAALADLAQAALEVALGIACATVGEGAQGCRLAVIGMGKTGGRELNYLSDVDVIFAAEPADGVDEASALAVGTQLATHLIRICSAVTPAGSLWQVDPALRPEGKQGPLVRTVASHRAYYERWAKTWEFQALLKARVVAGDRAVGAAYLAAIKPLVWQAAGRAHFVDDVQAMRRRVEGHVKSAEAQRQLKLGRGGLRDVEFSVQLLQLVHGRTDETLRCENTLAALAALTAGGYVGRDDAASMARAYRVLRTLEHRIQLHRMRRTHLMPTEPSELRRLGRALGYRADPAGEVLAAWQGQAREVRRLHERIFYRPLLAAVARLSSDEARLTPQAALDRLSALGFRDPRGALRHLEALTEGVSRRAAIQRQLLPVMLGWFADEADPDAGLLAFRKVSDTLGATHWYLKMLRDEGSAAERLAHTLGRSRFAADLLEQAPECVQYLGDARGLEPRSREDVQRRMSAAANRQGDLAGAVTAARAIRRSELFRIAVADLSGMLTIEQSGAALTDLSAALIEVALDQVCGRIAGDEPLTTLLVVGMGRIGGGELGYGSDADVVFVHDPLPGADEQAAQAQALVIVKELIAVLGRRGPDPSLEVDATLRPEGRNGPLVRSLSSYRTYYDRWSLVWEAQALLRATPIAGDRDLAAAYTDVIDPIRWPARGLTPAQLREIRTLKARMEAERLPRGADRKTHFKLGHGGLTDVEWCVQLIQLQHAHAHPQLRTTATLPALAAAAELGLINANDAQILAEAWRLVSATRDAGMLLRGRAMESLPADVREADGMARILSMPPGSGQELDERYRRITRRARRVTERLLYGS